MSRFHIEAIQYSRGLHRLCFCCASAVALTVAIFRNGLYLDNLGLGLGLGLGHRLKIAI